MEEVISKLEWERFSLPCQRNYAQNRRRGPVAAFRTFRALGLPDTGKKVSCLRDHKYIQP